MNESEHNPLREEKVSAGQDFVKKIGPAGCVLFLALFVLVTALCLTVGRNPLPGYEAPQDTAYYALHPEELAAELNENVLPRLEDPSVAQVSGDKVLVTVDAASFVPVRAALLHCFDESNLLFAVADTQP